MEGFPFPVSNFWTPDGCQLAGRAASSRSGSLEPVGRRGPPGQGREAAATALSEMALLLELEGCSRPPCHPCAPVNNLQSVARLSTALPARRVCEGWIWT